MTSLEDISSFLSIHGLPHPFLMDDRNHKRIDFYSWVGLASFFHYSSLIPKDSYQFIVENENSEAYSENGILIIKPRLREFSTVTFDD